MPAEKNPRSKELNPHMTPAPGFQRGPHWWETSALITAPSLHHKKQTDKQTNRQLDRQKKRQKERRTDGQMENKSLLFDRTYDNLNYKVTSSSRDSRTDVFLLGLFVKSWKIKKIGGMTTYMGPCLRSTQTYQAQPNIVPSS